VPAATGENRHPGAQKKNHVNFTLPSEENTRACKSCGYRRYKCVYIYVCVNTCVCVCVCDSKDVLRTWHPGEGDTECVAECVAACVAACDAECDA